MFLEELLMGTSIPEEHSSAAFTGLEEAVALGNTELYVQNADRSYDPCRLCFLLLNII